MSAEAGEETQQAGACCEVCPAQRLGPGGFDVAEPPFPGQAFVDGVRVIAELGTPICIPPWRVGLPPGRYASRAVPFPSQPGRRPDGCLMRQPDSGEHPDRIGLPPGAYASAGTPLPFLRRIWLRIRLAFSGGARPR